MATKDISPARSADRSSGGTAWNFPHRGRSHTYEELRFVAGIYTAAFNAGLPVQRTVAEKLEIPLSTAAKRIMAARREGFIPPVPRNRGENRD